MLQSMRLFVLIWSDLGITYLFYRLSFWLREQSNLLFFNSPLPREVYDYSLSHRYLWQMGLVSFYLFATDAYNIKQMRSRTKIAKICVGMGAFVVVANILQFFFLEQYSFPRSVLFVYFLVLVLGFFLWRWLLMRLFQNLNADEKIVLVGNNLAVDSFIAQIKQAHWLKYKIVGVLENFNVPAGTKKYQADLTYLGSFNKLPQVVERNQVNRIVLVEEPSTRSHLMSFLMTKGIFNQVSHVDLMPNAFEILISNPNDLQNLYDMPLIQLNESAPGFEELVRRLFDVLAALFFLVILSPFLLLAVCLILFENKGPVFFVQNRVGKNRKLFRIIKLRTMLPHNPRDRGLSKFHPQKNDERITRLGSFLRGWRMDEIPQLFNIIKGDMSFIGPRPEILIFVKRYERQIECYPMRFLVRPGLTGLAQVYGDYYTKAENKLKYDLAYIKNRSLFLDLKIIYKTVQVVLNRKGT